MRDVIRILASPVVWLGLFSAVYGLHGLLCEIVSDALLLGAPWRRVVLAVAVASGVFLQLGLLAMLYSERYGAAPGFARIVSRTSGWVGLVATVWTLLPPLMVSTCG